MMGKNNTFLMNRLSGGLSSMSGGTKGFGHGAYIGNRFSGD